MKINEVIVEGILGNIGSGLRNLAYKATGGAIGGDDAKQDIIRKEFIDRFSSEIKRMNASTISATKQPINLQTYLDKYFSRYKWTLDNQQITDVKRLINDVYLKKFDNNSLNKLSEYVYYLANENLPSKDRFGQSQSSGFTPQITQKTQAPAPAKAPTPSPQVNYNIPAVQRKQQSTPQTATPAPTKPRVVSGGPTPAEQQALQQKIAQASGQAGAKATVGRARGPKGRFVKKSPTV